MSSPTSISSGIETMMGVGTMSFAEHCVHCEHYHDESGTCCYCKKEFTELKKTPDEHRQEIEEILNEEDII